MANYISPQVAIKEVDLSTTIPSVASSIGALVIRNPWMGKENTRIFTTSMNEVVDYWGAPTSNSGNYEDLLSAEGYHAYGNALWTVGVRPDDATFGGLKSSVSSTGPSATFGTWTTSGSDSLTLADFDGGDVDTFGDTIIPTGDMDFCSVWRGESANRIRLAIVSSSTYNSMVRLKTLTEWSINQTVLGIDSPLEAADTKSFIVIVQFCPQGGDTTDENQWDTKEIFNVSSDTAAVDSQGRTKYCETIINSQSKYIRMSLKNSLINAAITTSPVNWVTFGGGSDGNTSTDMSSQIIDGYQRFENPEEIDVNIIIESDKTMAVKLAIIQLCADRLDCMGILDVPYALVVNNRGSETTSLVDYRLGLTPYELDNANFNSDKVALYANWLEVYDKYNKKYRWIPASGYMAGLWANNDNITDPWFAPAGLNRAIIQGSVRRLGWNPTQGQRDLLYKNGLNPICSFSGQGKVVWGQKTMLDENSAFNRINVRRLFIVLEKSCATAAKYFLFEPNDPATRLQLKGMIEPFLRDVKGRRGIYDFSVVCDDSNNTPERIDRNELRCDIYIAPVRAAEFIILQFVATKTGASFTELASAVGG